MWEVIQAIIYGIAGFIAFALLLLGCAYFAIVFLIMNAPKKRINYYDQGSDPDE